MMEWAGYAVTFGPESGMKKGLEGWNEDERKMDLDSEFEIWRGEKRAKAKGAKTGQSALPAANVLSTPVQGSMKKKMRTLRPCLVILRNERQGRTQWWWWWVPFFFFASSNCWRAAIVTVDATHLYIESSCRWGDLGGGGVVYLFLTYLCLSLCFCACTWACLAMQT